MEQEIDEFLEMHDKEQRIHILHRSLEKIMLTHRNTKAFFIMMSGPFLILLLLFKYSLKLLILYLLYQKANRKEMMSTGVTDGYDNLNR